MNNNTCLIIAGGEFDKEFASSYIREKWNGQGPAFLLVADRGLTAAKELQLTPQLIMGDFDSVDTTLLEEYRHKSEIMNFPPEKDYTDSHLAIWEAIKRGMKEICIMGATGTRIDHLLGNIGLLNLGLDADVDMEIVDSWNRIRMINREYMLQKDQQFGRYISLIPFDACVQGITLTGFKYPMVNGCLQREVSMGISNELVEEQGEITIQKGRLLIIESRD